MRLRHLILPLLLAPATAAAQGIIVPRCPRPMEGVVRPCPVGQSIVRTQSHVRVEVDGRVLRYTVDERFVNRGGGLGEADYVFPMPRGAAFQELRLAVNGELVAGETMSATEARRIYEDIVRRQRDPALVEWMGHGMLRTRVFPIQPGEEKRVVVRFTVVLEREGDAMRIDYSRGARAATLGDAGGETRSTFVLAYQPTRDWGRPYSPTHELDLRDSDGQRIAEARGAGGDVTVLIPVRRSGQPSIALLPHATGGEDGFALITVSPPAGMERSGTPRDITLVLDVSGSMSGRKMEQARAAGRQFLGTLRPHDRFRIIDFATDVRSFRDGYAQATPENIAAAGRYIDALDASGSTNISGALEEALRPEQADGRLTMVLFLTDGEPTVGERSPDLIAARAARNRGERRVFTFGVGADLNAALLERLAVDGGGTAQFVRPSESVERAVSLVASRLVDPVLTDVRISVDGRDVALNRMHPGSAIDLFAGQDLVVLARYRGTGRAQLVVEGRRMGQRVRWTSDVDLPERQRENPFVARLWAVQRIGFLSAERRRQGGSSEVDSEIRQLGERFGIPTEFTSYLVVEPGMTVANTPQPQVRRGAMGDLSSRGMATSGAGAASPAAAPVSAQDKAFEEARAASAQRGARSVAEADAVARERGIETRSAAGRTFVRRGARWEDSRYRSGGTTLRIKAFSPAYFALLERVGDLRAPAGLGDNVIVMFGDTAVEIGDDGAETLSDSELSRLAAAWRT